MWKNARLFIFCELWKELELPANSLQFLNATHLIYLAAKRLLVNFFRMLCKWRWSSLLVSATRKIQLRHSCKKRRRLLLSIKYLFNNLKRNSLEQKKLAFIYQRLQRTNWADDIFSSLPINFLCSFSKCFLHASVRIFYVVLLFLS